jgi:hypothetical protein
MGATFWSHRTVAAGTQGPLVYAVTRHRVTLGQDEQPAQPVWLRASRTRGEPAVSSSSIRKAPVSPSLSLLVWLSGRRWAIEQWLEEMTPARGLAH